MRGESLRLPVQLRNLRVFCDVVGKRSFSKAAEANEMTQGGASHVVQQLEECLQVKLIDRTKRPFVLTAEGSVFHAGCLKILRDFDALIDEVQSIGREVKGEASIAAIYSVGLSYLPELKQAVANRYPEAKVRFQFGHPDEVYRLVEQGLVDFGLLSYPNATKSVLTLEWREEQMILAAASDNPLRHAAEVTQADLCKQSLVAFAPNLRIRHEIDRYLRQLGVTMQIAAELDNIDSVRHAMEVNEAVAFLPEPSVREEIEKGNVCALNCPWLDMTRPLGVVQRRNESLGRTARSVMELILESSDEALGRKVGKTPATENTSSGHKSGAASSLASETRRAV